jgi:hypothetical protein
MAASPHSWDFLLLRLSYVDASGIAHGFLARVKGTPPTREAGTEMKAFDSRPLVTPLNPSPSAWGGAMPAR